MMRATLLSTALVSSTALTLASPASAQVFEDPHALLRRDTCFDREIASWKQVSEYFTQLDEAPTVKVNAGIETPEGRQLLEVVISSPANLARLDEIRAHNRTLAYPDPFHGDSDLERDRARAVERAIDGGRTTVVITNSLHATELASTEASMELTYLLAFSLEEPWRSARDELVVVLYPSLNPDGVDKVHDWYEETKGTPYEGVDLVELYQKFAGHDNNRDWFMLTQPETQWVTERLYAHWYPHVLWDAHQHGKYRERFFLPPFRDPLNPNIDPSIVTAIDALGSRALFDLTQEGLQGVATGLNYDMWWNGGNRSVPVRHNVIGLLTEAASCDLATPVFLRPSQLLPPLGLDAYAPSNHFPDPWDGGKWGLRDIQRYYLAFARSLLSTLVREPQLWRKATARATNSAMRGGLDGGPTAWLIPREVRDPHAARRLVDVLMKSGIRLERTMREEEIDGTQWPAGTLVARRDQPYGAHLKDLMEVQDYPAGAEPYDVTGWTLPVLLGVHRVAVRGPLPVRLEPVKPEGDTEYFLSRDMPGTELLLDTRHTGTWGELAGRMAQGERWGFAENGVGRAGFLVTQPNADGAGAPTLPRIAVYAPWSASTSEGWLRFGLEQLLEIPYSSVRNGDLSAGRLIERFDTLVLPSVSPALLARGRTPGALPERFMGGLDPEGAVAIEEFVRAGGRLIAIGDSTSYVSDLLSLPVENSLRTPPEGAEPFRCPGAILRCLPVVHELTADLPASVAVMLSGGHAWRPLEVDVAGLAGEPEVLLRYAPTRTLWSGWMQGAEAIQGQGAWLRVPYGNGAVHLFGFEPQYRGWSQQALGLLARALLLDTLGG